MTANDMEVAFERTGDPDQLVMGSTLAEMERLPVWVASVAAARGLPGSVTFAINLCLEEVVSNVIRHGYGGRPGQLLTVGRAEPRPGYLVFTVEDDAAPFNPLQVAGPPPIRVDEAGLGGQGIRLLRGFADTLEYEAKVGGNRIRVGFVVPVGD